MKTVSYEAIFDCPRSEAAVRLTTIDRPSLAKAAAAREGLAGGTRLDCTATGTLDPKNSRVEGMAVRR